MLRTAWRNFYGDATAMIGLYGCAGIGCFVYFWWLVCPLRHRSAISRLSAFTTVMVTLWRSLFFLGTDDLGRDVLSRLLSGAALTVGGAFVVTLAATLCGLVLGVVAGATHGLRSVVLNHILDTLLSIPSLLLAIIVVAFAGPHLTHAMRLPSGWLCYRAWCSVYSMVHDELEKEYVIAARSMVQPH